MMVPFQKYEGTGNDFIMIDNRNNVFNNDANEISRLCDRKFGIGADGLILLNRSEIVDFSMAYYNTDGVEVDMCGNGGRCIIAFANSLGIINDKGKFIARDGLHEGIITDHHGDSFMVNLTMQDVEDVILKNDHYLINTGVPHYVKFVEDTDNVNVVEEGSKIRYSDQFRESGINVDFCHLENEILVVRTYERGVEDETLSCGTGVTAASIAAFLRNGLSLPVSIRTRGGDLAVSFKPSKNSFKSVHLSGPVSMVFQGNFTAH